MLVLVQASIMTVGLNGENEVLKELPVRVISIESGYEAARSLKNENIDGIISRWDLRDMKDGWFLRKFRLVKPEVPTIAIIRSDSPQSEIDARSLGVSAVLTEDTSDSLFLETVSNVLGLEKFASIKAIATPRKRTRRSSRVVRSATDIRRTS